MAGDRRRRHRGHNRHRRPLSARGQRICGASAPLTNRSRPCCAGPCSCRPVNHSATLMIWSLPRCGFYRFIRNSPARPGPYATSPYGASRTAFSRWKLRLSHCLISDNRAGNRRIGTNDQRVGEIPALARCLIAGKQSPPHATANRMTPTCRPRKPAPMRSSTSNSKYGVG
jgi:hypothetical protein